MVWQRGGGRGATTMDAAPASQSPDQPPAQARAGPPDRAGHRRHRLRIAAVAGVGVLILGLVGAELVARFVLGMGDPPLYQTDPQIEYLPVPGRTYRRFGNVVSYNSVSMRSPELPARKSDPSELRVMVLGDSVVNGGSLTDQSDLATSRLPDMLRNKLGRPVVVGNVSSGSWGPPNLLAYVERYGLFDADVVVIVLNSEDPFDVPTFGPLGPDQPTRSPVLALEEAIRNYLPRYYRALMQDSAAAPPTPPEIDPEHERIGLAALENLIAKARSTGATVLLVHHFKLSELQSGQPEPGYHKIRELAARLGVPLTDTKEHMLPLLRDGRGGYRDNIHPDAAGQAALADVLAQQIAEAVLGRP